MSGHGGQPMYHRLESNEAEIGHELSIISARDGDSKSPMKTTASLLGPDSNVPAQGDQNENPVDVQPTKRFTGWKVGAVTGASLSAVTLIANVAALIYLKKTDQESLVEVFRGDCHRVEQMQMWGHFAINGMSAILLAASNYSMQVLSAPTRSEIDRAHGKGKWLDIGVQSPRNLGQIAPWRAALWWVLCLSSAPLHLMYNSAFYASIANRSYDIWFMTPDYESFTADQDLLVGSGHRGQEAEVATHIEDMIRLSADSDSDRVEILDPAACLNAYARILVTDRSNVIIVTKNETRTSNETALIKEELYSFDNALTKGGASYTPFSWICHHSSRMDEHFEEDNDRSCDVWIGRIKRDIDSWTPMDFSVDHCLSERVEEQCSFNGNTEILIVVITCNAIKVVCMLVVAFGLGQHPPLITIGDGISSFLQRPDPATQGCCLLDRKDFITLAKAPGVKSPGMSQLKTLASTGKRATRQDRTWANAASHTRWAITIGCLMGSVFIVVVFFGVGRAVLAQIPGVSLNTIGFGTLHPAAVITGWGIEKLNRPIDQIRNSALIANIPQLVFSFLYVNLNSLVTCMWLSSEWNDYSMERKPLRVSMPRAEQRTTYFLQLPYRVGIPLIITSGFLHWLISQSLFLAVVADYNWDGTLGTEVSIATCGFSLIPMIIVMIAGAGLSLGTVLLGTMRKLKGEGFMPLASSCSLALAAACHAPDGEERAHLTGVMWGAVSGKRQGLEEGFRHSIDGGGLGHCSFTSGEVLPVQEGRLYA